MKLLVKISHWQAWESSILDIMQISINYIHSQLQLCLTTSSIHFYSQCINSQQCIHFVQMSEGSSFTLPSPSPNSKMYTLPFVIVFVSALPHLILMISLTELGAECDKTVRTLKPHVCQCLWFGLVEKGILQAIGWFSHWANSLLAVLTFENMLYHLRSFKHSRFRYGHRI